MNDHDIAKVCLLLVVVGTIALFFMTEAVKPARVRVAEIDASFVGRGIEVTGTIKSISVSNNNVFISLFDGQEIKVVMFKSVASKAPDVYGLQKNDSVLVAGKVDNYQGTIEVVASVIKKL